MNRLIESTLAPFYELGNQLVRVLPGLLAMGVMLAVGIGLAIVARKLLARALKAIRFDDFAWNVGFASLLFKANINQTPTWFISNILYGLIIIVVLLMGVSAINMTAASQAVGAVFRWLPNFLIALVILVVGYVVSKFVGRSVLLTAVNAEIRSARLVSLAVQALILLFTISFSLEQIGLAQNTIIAAFSIIFGGLVLALSIAFGLGGRDIAKDYLEQNVKKPEADEYSEDQPFSHL